MPDHTQDALSAALRDRRSSKKARDAVGAAPNKWRGLVARLFHLRFVEGEDACSKMFSHILIDSAGPAGFLSH